MVGVPEVSVVVPVRDGSGYLASLLDALAAQTVAAPFEVVIVDDGSRDHTGGLAAAHSVVDRVVRQPPQGAYAARNAGAAAAHAPVLAFTDADCRPSPQWLAEGLAAIEQGADIVGGAIVALRSRNPSVWERYDRATYLRQRDFVEDQGFAATANLFVRRHVLETTGGFDHRLRSSGDLVWCRRATEAGHRLAYSPGAVVGHLPRTSMRAIWSLHRRLGAGWAVLARRGQRPPWWRDAALRPSLGQAVAAVAEDGPLLRRRHLLPVHLTVVAARLTGRLTARG